MKQTDTIVAVQLSNLDTLTPDLKSLYTNSYQHHPINPIGWFPKIMSHNVKSASSVFLAIDIEDLVAANDIRTIMHKGKEINVLMVPISIIKWHVLESRASNNPVCLETEYKPSLN